MSFYLMFNGLPTPSAEELAHSQHLVELIKQKIATSGPIAFAEYMQLALYAPKLGYYSAGKIKLGASGDFVTAPEISPLYSQCIAKQCQQILTVLNGGDILEFGAGSGIMAADILLTLEQWHCLPNTYYILEVSPDLKQCQKELLTARCPHLLEKIKWLTTLPNPGFQGVILANEILDAMPVHRFCIHKKEMCECHVNWQNEKFAWSHAKTRNPDFEQMTELLRERYLMHMEYYHSECNLYLAPWINSVSDCLAQGLILIIDYGFPQQEYYHPQRHMGTLMCHYRHFAHSDPLILTGLQDVTAHVDFTAVANSGAEAQLDVAGYATQAGFLFSCGILEFADQQTIPFRQQLLIRQQIKQLTQPHEMGELFKVMALTRNIETSLVGFTLQDLRAHL